MASAVTSPRLLHSIFSSHNHLYRLAEPLASPLHTESDGDERRRQQRRAVLTAGTRMHGKLASWESGPFRNIVFYLAVFFERELGIGVVAKLLPLDAIATSRTRASTAV